MSHEVQEISKIKNKNATSVGSLVDRAITSSGQNEAVNPIVTTDLIQFVIPLHELVIRHDSDVCVTGKVNSS